MKGSGRVISCCFYIYIEGYSSQVSLSSTMHEANTSTTNPMDPRAGVRLGPIMAWATMNSPAPTTACKNYTEIKEKKKSEM